MIEGDAELKEYNELKRRLYDMEENKLISSKQCREEIAKVDAVIREKLNQYISPNIEVHTLPPEQPVVEAKVATDSGNTIPKDIVEILKVGVEDKEVLLEMVCKRHPDRNPKTVQSCISDFLGKMKRRESKWSKEYTLQIRLIKNQTS